MICIKIMVKAACIASAGILQGTSSGVQYEQRRLTEAVGDSDPADVLPNTRVWLQSGFTKVRPLHHISFQCCSASQCIHVVCICGPEAQMTSRKGTL